MQNKVYIAHRSYEYGNMFEAMNWKVVEDMRDANLVQFTGGHDVSPSLYGQSAHNFTHCNPYRDKKELYIYALCVKHGIPMAGICRGGQFLNVANGGWMWQHVDGHAVAKTHKVVDLESGTSWDATSTHHQAMAVPMPRHNIPCKVVAVAKEATFKEKIGKSGHIVRVNSAKLKDIEVLFYEQTKSFCFQPHPEFGGFTELRTVYFDYLDKYLGFNQEREIICVE